MKDYKDDFFACKSSKENTIWLQKTFYKSSKTVMVPKIKKKNVIFLCYGTSLKIKSSEIED